MLFLAFAGAVAKTVYSTPERVIRFDQAVVLTITYAGGYSEPYTLPQDGPVAMMRPTTPGQVRLRFWNEARAYGVVDLFDDWVRLHIRS